MERRDPLLVTRRSFLAGSAALAVAPATAGEPWESRQFPNWNRELADRLLTDSPWARPLTLPFEFQPVSKRLRTDFSQIELPPGIGLPRGGGPTGRSPRTASPGPTVPTVPARSEIYLTVRWSSALPIRQALAWERFGREAGGAVAPAADEYVIEIFGFPVLSVPQGAAWLEQELGKTGALHAKGRREIRATASRVPEHGNHLYAELRFPRTDPFVVDDGVVELAAEAGPMKILQKFKLKAMSYRGQLEL